MSAALTMSSETFSGHREATRLRLTPREAQTLRYVLGEWAGEAGLSSNTGAQLERLASDARLLGAKAAAEPPKSETELTVAQIVATTGDDSTGADLVEVAFGKSVRLARGGGRRQRHDRGSKSRRSREWTWRDDWERERRHTYVNASQPTSFHGWEMTRIDEWSDQRRDKHTGEPHRDQLERDARMRCWRALRALADVLSPSLVILAALYGDTLPGLPRAGLWTTADGHTPSAADGEYRRVVRYLTADDLVRQRDVDLRPAERCLADVGSSGARLEAYIDRLSSNVPVKQHVLRELGRACERLITRAAIDYRNALESTT